MNKQRTLKKPRIRKVLRIVAAFCLTLTMLYIPSDLLDISIKAAGNCSGGHNGMSPWNKETSGSFYLTGPVNLTDAITLTGDLTLCLNGQTITQGTSDKSIFIVNSGYTLTLLDCKSNSGKLTGVNSTEEKVINHKNAPVYVNGGTFNMYGGSITNNKNKQGGGVHIDKGTFNMYGGSISDNQALRNSTVDGTYYPYSGRGGGVYLHQNGNATFNLSGGTIKNNIAEAQGGGVYVNDRNIINMSGGTIQSNTSGKSSGTGGGIFLGWFVDFTMSGGVISDNIATDGDGGGVYNGGSSTFIMEGGTISGNKANNGNGITAYGSFEMTGGEITNNISLTTYGSGLYVYSSNKVALSGTVKISGNKTSNGADANVYIYKDSILTIEDGFNTVNPIGISGREIPADCANPVTIINTSSDVLAKFKSEYSSSDGVNLVYHDDEGVINVEKPHTSPVDDPAVAATCTTAGKTAGKHCDTCQKVITAQNTVEALGHNYTYTASGATITEKCNRCNGHSATAKLSLSGTSYTYTGSAIKPTATVTYSDNWAGEKPTTVNYKNNTKAGTATASITIEGKTATANFTISKKNITPKVSISGWTYGGTAQNPSVTGNSGSGTVTYQYKLRTAADSTYSTTKPTNAGTYTVKATIAATTNYNGGTATANFTISKATPTVTAPTAKTLTYTGSAQGLVSAGGTTGGTLKYSIDGTNYNTSIPTGVNADTYTVYYKVEGNDNYNAVAEKSISVKISPKSISSVTISDIADQTYKVGEITPAVTVKDGSTTLVAGTDYTVSYSNNTSVGTATVTIIGKGNYTETADKTFEITAATLEGVSANGYTGIYDGAAHGITVTVTAPTGAAVTYGTSADKCTENVSPTYTNVGTYTVFYQITKDNYDTVTDSATVTINAKSLTDEMVTVASGTHEYNGTAIKPDITVKDGSTTLTIGTDYTVSYSNNTDVGTATVTVEGIGNYTGTIEKNFTIIHTHTFSPDWSKDDTNHWHAATCGHDVADGKEGHTWNDGVVTKEPTCTEKGIKTYTCTVCDKTKTEEIKTKDHTEVVDEAKPATCTEPGLTEGKHCSVCNEVLVNQEVIPALGHRWNDGVVTTEPTEEAEGVMTYTCTVCFATKTESIDKLAHTHVWSDTYQYDDTQHWKVCTKCHEADTKVDHIWDIGTVTTEPTCTQTGEKTYTCTVCEKTKTETLAATGHSFSDMWERNETSHWHGCTKCGEKSDTATHSSDGGAVTTEPTEFEAGVRTYTCTVCKFSWTEEISALGHSFGTEWKRNETDHWHECVCGAKTDVFAHIKNEGVMSKAATCTESGEMTYICTVCGYSWSEEIPALGHSYGTEWINDEANHWHECFCGAKTDVASHIKNEGVTSKASACTESGEKTYSCTICGYSWTEEIPALGHSFGAEWMYDEANHWHECFCGEKSEETLHIPSDWIVEAFPTTDLEGVKIKKCTVCNTELERAAIEKLTNNGNIAEEVQDTAGTNSELVQDNMLIENTLTPEDITEIEKGSSFDIVLEVTDIKDRVPAKDAEAAPTALKPDEKIGVYVDLSLFKIKDNNAAGKTAIHETSGEIGITLTIPDSIYGADRTYSIIRVHDGNAENLGGTYDKASRKLTFYTDKFSTYAIAYTASNVETDNHPSTPSIPSTPSKPSVPTTDNTTPVPPSKPAVTPTVTETTAKKEEETLCDEPYVEDVSAGAGINDDSEDNTHSSKNYAVIIILAAASVVGFILRKKVSK